MAVNSCYQYLRIFFVCSTLDQCFTFLLRQDTKVSSSLQDYEPSICDVQNVTYAKNLIRCMFCATSGKDAKTKEKGKGACMYTKFPCSHIWVLYQPAEGGKVLGMLHPDSLQASGQHSQVTV